MNDNSSRDTVTGTGVSTRPSRHAETLPALAPANDANSRDAGISRLTHLQSFFSTMSPDLKLLRWLADVLTGLPCLCLLDCVYSRHSLLVKALTTRLVAKR